MECKFADDNRQVGHLRDRVPSTRALDKLKELTHVSLMRLKEDKC